MIDSWIFDDHAEFGYIYECPYCKFHLFVDSNDEDLRPEKCPQCNNTIKMKYPVMEEALKNEIINISEKAKRKTDFGESLIWLTLENLKYLKI